METNLQGSYVALVTPFETGNGINNPIDITGVRKLVRYQGDNGTTGILINGTTGESPTIEFDEFSALIDVARQEIARGGYDMQLLIGTGTNATGKSLKLTERALQAEPDAVMAVSPYYNKPTQQGLYVHFTEIASAAGDVPVIIYDIPGRVVIDVDTNTSVRIAEARYNIQAFKEAAGVEKFIDRKQEIDAAISKGTIEQPISYLSGDDPNTAEIIANDGDGVISVLANLTPNLVKQHTTAALDWDFELVTELEETGNFNELAAGMFLETNPGPVKAALAMMPESARIQEAYRAPMVPISDRNRTALESILREAHLI
tara:strand:+ start:15779 stop:16729 length:951 start_codon:yes stop_codon:yes gene_type:complete